MFFIACGGDSPKNGNPPNPERVTVPNVAGKTEAEARSAITSAGLTVGTVNYETHAAVPSGSVISQTPASGTSVTKGSAVNLRISTGPAQVLVPDVVGMTEAVARTTITSAGLTIGTITYEIHEVVPSGKVFSQDPEAEIFVAVEIAVNLRISSGPASSERVQTPNVVNMTEAAARTAIESAGLTVGAVIYAAHETVPSGSVISQSPAAGISVEVETPVNLRISFTDPFIDRMVVFVEGGTFTMGCTEQQAICRIYPDEFPPHDVTLSDFFIGKYEVAQGQWKAVMGADNNPSWFKGDNLPMQNVSWNDVQKFIERLNEMSGRKYRLPTEAEWEYAARGGNQSQGYVYSGSNTVGEVAWYEGNSKIVQPVGTKYPNELGIYDMSGNVFELVSDWFGNYSDEPQTDPTGPVSGSLRIGRGGSWYTEAEVARVSARVNSDPNNVGFDLGFRLARSIE